MMSPASPLTKRADTPLLRAQSSASGVPANALERLDCFEKHARAQLPPLLDAAVAIPAGLVALVTNLLTIEIAGDNYRIHTLQRRCITSYCEQHLLPAQSLQQCVDPIVQQHKFYELEIPCPSHDRFENFQLGWMLGGSFAVGVVVAGVAWGVSAGTRRVLRHYSESRLRAAERLGSDHDAAPDVVTHLREKLTEAVRHNDCAKVSYLIDKLHLPPDPEGSVDLMDLAAANGAEKMTDCLRERGYVTTRGHVMTCIDKGHNALARHLIDHLPEDERQGSAEQIAEWMLRLGPAALDTSAAAT